MKTALTALTLSLASSSVSADLQVVSRSSTYDAYSYYAQPTHPLETCTSSISTTAFGLWNEQTSCGQPNQYVYADGSTPPIGGDLRGSGSARFMDSAGTVSESRLEHAMTVRFDVVDRPAEVRLDFAAQAYPWFPFMTELPNTTLRITEITTNRVVFEILRDGTATLQTGTKRYAQQEWTAELPVGQYRLEAAGNGRVQYDAGGGSQTPPYGYGGPTFSLTVLPCAADFNSDGFLDFFDYDAYVLCFELGDCPQGRSADFNGDGFTDFFDYDAFVTAFEEGC